MKDIKPIVAEINKLKNEGIILSDPSISKILKATKNLASKNHIINLITPFFEAQYIEDQFKTLTKREREIVTLIGDGKNSKAIASQLRLSVTTIETHRKNIKKKLKLKGRGKLIEYAILKNIEQFNKTFN